MINDQTTLPRAATGDLDTIAAVVETLAALGREHDQRERSGGERRQALRSQGVAEIQRIQTLIEKPSAPASLVQERERIEATRQRRLAHIAAAGTRQRRALRERHEPIIAALVATKRTPSEHSQTTLQRRRDSLNAIQLKLNQRLQEVELACNVIVSRHGLGEVTVAAPAELALPAEPESALAAVGEAVGRLEQALANSTVSSASRASARPIALMMYAGIAVAHLLAIGLCLSFLRMPELTLWLGGSLIISLVVAWVVIAILRVKLRRRLAQICSDLAASAIALVVISERLGKPFDPAQVLRQKVDRILEQDAEIDERIRVLSEEHQQALARSKAREAALVERLHRSVTNRIQALERQAHAAGAGRLAELHNQLAAAQTALAQRLQEAEVALVENRRDLAALVHNWQQQARALETRLFAQQQANHPDWDDAASWSRWSPPVDWGREVPIGTMTARVSELAALVDAGRLPVEANLTLRFPVALSYPGSGSLLIRSGASSKPAAVRMLNQTVLRALTSFPPGRVRLTIIDPIGLGQTFPRLLDLAEHDESVLSGGILSEVSRIERGLDDLCAHLEKVIQKHLRGKYATLDEYNREAGELQEPTRLVVIADFPAGFSERSLERLSILLHSGARCGVHLLIIHDDRQPLPSAIDLAWLRRSSIVMRHVHDHLTLDRERGFALEPERELDQALSARLITAIGNAAVSAKRVALPFSAIAPDPTAMWSLFTAERLRLPIGKCGADRLQYLELGRGTAQHVLVGGRTGSGKSTLFHVLLTSAALWFHPRELELHLIDFKKGVEFKAYATHRLPHAKVVAIESDREFGLSVLRNLDAELTRRGDLFRKAGAQDLAAHRRYSAAQHSEHLPRIVLLIDEFQELFTDDDAIARDSALLLDRFVRQGRAFGLHVVLGSQTLSGSYSMAKSSLGQMGVRIVLPCNEANANLLLHEDNDGARLLSRPGDAIYNDQAGLRAANSPFQVCWLNDQEQASQLAAISARALAEDWKPVRQVIFEGDGPSHLEDESELLALAERRWTASASRMRAWVGQSSSLRGAAEIDLSASGGGNLVMIGQHREAAVATGAAIHLALALRYRGSGVRLLSLDGEDSAGPWAGVHARMASVMTPPPIRHEAREAQTVIQELAQELDRRQSNGAVEEPIVLTVFALHRLRALRQDDDAPSSRGGESAADAFARILNNGPEVGIHIITWIDSLTSLQRTLGRRGLKAFDQHICFQMSASDSTEILDDDAASRLGLHTALLTAQGEGRREKFRPYRIPDVGVITAIIGSHI